MNNDNNGRLLSLDVLRGIDLMLLVGLQPVLRAFLVELDCEALNSTLLYQLDHAQWEGLRAWDLVMPLFLFMSGVTMPYSLPKYRTQNGNLKVWQRVLKRFALLFILGMVVQGNIQQHLAGNCRRISAYRAACTLPEALATTGGNNSAAYGLLNSVASVR